MCSVQNKTLPWSFIVSVPAQTKERSWDTSVSAVWTTMVRFSAVAENFFLRHRVQTGSGSHPASYPTGSGALSPGVRGWGVKLTTHLHLVPRLRKREAIPPLPQYVFMAWCLVKHRGNFIFPRLIFLKLYLTDHHSNCWNIATVLMFLS
jgi:hypothetical protein